MSPNIVLIKGYTKWNITLLSLIEYKHRITPKLLSSLIPHFIHYFFTLIIKWKKSKAMAVKVIVQWCEPVLRLFEEEENLINCGKLNSTESSIFLNYYECVNSWSQSSNGYIMQINRRLQIIYWKTSQWFLNYEPFICRYAWDKRIGFSFKSFHLLFIWRAMASMTYRWLTQTDSLCLYRNRVKDRDDRDMEASDSHTEKTTQELI